MREAIDQGTPRPSFRHGASAGPAPEMNWPGAGGTPEYKDRERQLGGRGVEGIV